MKKILLAIDGSYYSKGAMEFAKWLNAKHRILLVGMFIPKTDYAYLWTYAGDGVNSTMFLPLVEDGDSPDVKKTIEHFEDECKRNDIEFRVHKDYNSSAIISITNESRYADLLLLGSETFYSNYSGENLSEYLKDTLHEIECPAIVVPEKYNFPESNVIAYDGSKSSVFALRQFAYLFPELLNNKTVLVNSKEEADRNVPDQILIEELAARHFKNLTISKNNSDADNYFNTLLLAGKKAILISGSYGRGGIGKLFHKSFVSELIKEHGIPVFIAHK